MPYLWIGFWPQNISKSAWFLLVWLDGKHFQQNVVVYENYFSEKNSILDDFPLFGCKTSNFRLNLFSFVCVVLLSDKVAESVTSLPSIEKVTFHPWKNKFQPIFFLDLFQTKYIPSLKKHYFLPTKHTLRILRKNPHKLSRYFFYGSLSFLVELKVVCIKTKLYR